MTTKKKNAPHNTGYRQFMSGFSTYARENNIHIHGGRGSFARQVSLVWKDLKGKPEWKDNLDVILPPYLEGIEGAPPIRKDRLQSVIEEFGAEQFEWWNLKNLYGLWTESINVIPEKDRLLVVIEEDDTVVELKTDLDAFGLYNAYRSMPENNDSNTASYLRFRNAEMNDDNGIDLTFSSQSAEGYMVHLHSKSTFDWSQKVKEKYTLQKEAIGIKGVGKIARTRVNIRAAGRREAKEISRPGEVQRTKAVVKKLDELNKAINKLEEQYSKGLVNKTDYRKYLKKLYKM
jgi:hypothetical protein